MLLVQVLSAVNSEISNHLFFPLIPHDLYLNIETASVATFLSHHSQAIKPTCKKHHTKKEHKTGYTYTYQNQIY